jgi:3'(2'), 5'-bisphosphate nucleotidase
MTERENLLNEVVEIAREAGEAILKVYENEDLGVSTKDDDSPLTRADMDAHNVIIERLAERTPDIPVHSEESEGVDWQERRHWQRFWLVDPLDGTKEFINRNGEFTVNIALVEHNRPTLGVVHVPARNTTYLGLAESGAWVEREGERQSIQARPLGETVVMVASRSHGSEKVDALAERIEHEIAPVERTNMGSSLKFCLVAEGAADIYPRLSPTSEWDTAAAHAVVRAAGGTVVDTDFNELQYNLEEDVLNPSFLVFGAAPEKWEQKIRDLV